MHEAWSQLTLGNKEQGMPSRPCTKSWTAFEGRLPDLGGVPGELTLSLSAIPG